MAFLIIYLILAVITAAIAGHKGRSRVGWFFCGLFFGIFAILLVSLLHSKKEEADYREYVERENRMLKEQLKQERIKAEAFRGHVAQRLDKHDDVLGLDTRQTAMPAALPGAAEQPLELELHPAGRAAPSDNAQQWYYQKEGSEHGPLTRKELMLLVRNGLLPDSALVWKEGLRAWTPANQVSDLRDEVYQ